jgi:hypothetical protein
LEFAVNPAGLAIIRNNAAGSMIVSRNQQVFVPVGPVVAVPGDLAVAVIDICKRIIGETWTVAGTNR